MFFCADRFQIVTASYIVCLGSRSAPLCSVGLRLKPSSLCHKWFYRKHTWNTEASGKILCFSIRWECYVEIDSTVHNVLKPFSIIRTLWFRYRCVCDPFVSSSLLWENTMRTSCGSSLVGRNIDTDGYNVLITDRRKNWSNGPGCTLKVVITNSSC